MTAVHYKGGGETIKDLLSGQVKVMFSTIPPVLGFVREGKLRGIATTGPKRDAALPDLPTIAEAALPGYDVRLWFGMSAPKGTPRPVIEKLSTALKQALESDDTKSKLAAAGYATQCRARPSSSAPSTRARSPSGPRWSRRSARWGIDAVSFRSGALWAPITTASAHRDGATTRVAPTNVLYCVAGKAHLRALMYRA